MSRNPASDPQGYVPVLDGVRGLAIALVLLFHFFRFGPGDALSNAVTRFTQVGWLGVDVFFVLSGYLITGVLVRERGSPAYLRNFYMRRVLRIFPAYFFVLAVIYFLVTPWHLPLRDADMTAEWISLLFYVSNWQMLMAGSWMSWHGLNHTWSLAIEEQFYLLWPFVVLMLPRAWLLYVALGTAVCSALSKPILLALDANWFTIYMATFTRLDGLLVGAWLAMLPVSEIPKWKPWLRCGGLVGLAGLLLLFVIGDKGGTGRGGAVLGTLSATLAFGWLIFCIRAECLTPRLKWALTTAPMLWLGRYSYGLYLIHWPLYVILVEAYGDVGTPLGNVELLGLGMVSLLLTLMFALLMYRFIEAPALRLKSRYHSRKKST